MAVPLAWLHQPGAGLARRGAGVYAVGCGSRRHMATVGCGAYLLLIGSRPGQPVPPHLAGGHLRGDAGRRGALREHTSAVGTTSLGEYTPMWATTHHRSPLIDDYREGRPINRLRVLPDGARAKCSSEHAPATLRPVTDWAGHPDPEPAYFPGWQATVDGAPATVAPHPGSGLLDVFVPAGEHELVLRFGATPLRRLPRVH